MARNILTNIKVICEQNEVLNVFKHFVSVTDHTQKSIAK